LAPANAATAIRGMMAVRRMTLRRNCVVFARDKKIEDLSGS